MRFTRLCARFARPVVVVAAAVAVATLLAPSVGAEDAAVPADKTEIALRDGIAVADLLRIASSAADVPIVWSDSDKVITGKKVQGAQRLLLEKAEVFDTVRDLLASQEVVLVPVGMRGKATFVAMDARMLQNQFILGQRPETVEMNDVAAARLEGRSGLFVQATIRVPGAESATDLRDIRTALARLVTGQNVGSVQEIPSAQSIVVTDFAPRVVAIYRFIKSLPPRPETKAEFFLLEHANAGRVESILGDLLAARPAPARPEPAPQAGPGAAARVDGPRIVSDAATNQVIVVGTAAQLELARQIVQHLDVAPRPAPGK